MDYIDNLMNNHQVSSEESANFDSPDIHNYNQTGGASDNNRPTGGFPPIYMCKSKEVEDQVNDTKARAYNKPTQTISIKDILIIKKENKPFLSF